MLYTYSRMVRFYRKRCRVIFVASIVLVSVILLFYKYKKIFLESQNFLKKTKNDVDNANAKDDGNIVVKTTKMAKPLHVFAGEPSIMSSSVHGFYYGWYGNIEVDNYYYHWNHQFLPHWTKRISDLYATGERHFPPDDIGASFFPKLGPYSSFDRNVIEQHMNYLVQAGIGVLALSWYPIGMSDDEGKPMNDLVPILLEIANVHGIKVCFHIEPYKGRSAFSVAADIEYLIRTYGSYPAFYTTNNHLRNPDRILPLVYVYDSYLISPQNWSLALGGGSRSIRGGKFDAIVIGLLVEEKHKRDIVDSGFDGFYTYFASSGFSYGSNTRHWQFLSNFASSRNLIFIPSVGPGYDDTNVRPWNGANTKDRDNGRYYDAMWSEAIATKCRFVSITSFNEWHEGTQIEPAVGGKVVDVKYLHGKKQPGKFSYKSYGQNPNFYLDLTKKWVEKKVKSNLITT